MYFLAFALFVLAFNSAALAKEPTSCVHTSPPNIDDIKGTFSVISKYNVPFLGGDCAKITLDAKNNTEITVTVTSKDANDVQFTARLLQFPNGNYEISVDDQETEEHSFIFIMQAKGEGFVLIGCKWMQNEPVKLTAAVFHNGVLSSEREADIKRALESLSLDLSKFNKVEQGEEKCAKSVFRFPMI